MTLALVGRSAFEDYGSLTSLSMGRLLFGGSLGAVFTQVLGLSALGKGMASAIFARCMLRMCPTFSLNVCENGNVGIGL